MFKKMLFVIGYATAASTASASSLVLPGDIINVECKGIKFSVERVGDFYKANFPDSTIEYDSISTEHDLISLLTKDNQGHKIRVLAFNYVTNTYFVSNSQGGSDKVINKYLAKDFINDESNRGTVDTFKGGAVPKWRTIDFHMPLELSITGIEQTLESITRWDANKTAKPNIYVDCFLHEK